MSLTPIHSLCIVGLDAWPVLSAQQVVQFVGGEPVQHVLLARAWRDLGLQVSILVYDHGQPPDTVVDGIRAIAAFKRSAGLPVLRFVYPRMTSVFTAMRRAAADVYYQSPAGVETGYAAWYCRRHRRRFIFRIASDANCTPGAQLINYWRDRKLFEYGMKNAHLIAAQTEHQRRLLQSNYELRSALVNMVAEPGPAILTRPKDIDVLWVSNFRTVKRPEVALDVARELPHLKFSMVGGALPGMEDYYERVSAAARQLPNVTVHGAVPYQDVGTLFERSRLFLNTSTVEGFPNTFLQAWMRALPVVSTFDPDGLIGREQLGVFCSTPAELAPAIQRLLATPETLDATGRRARTFAMREYSPESVARRYLTLLQG
jgi:glycosyltransferase involved in cell wall biosynthesis